MNLGMFNVNAYPLYFTQILLINIGICIFMQAIGLKVEYIKTSVKCPDGYANPQPLDS